MKQNLSSHWYDYISREIWNVTKDHLRISKTKMKDICQKVLATVPTLRRCWWWVFKSFQLGIAYSSRNRLIGFMYLLMLIPEYSGATTLALDSLAHCVISLSTILLTMQDQRTLGIHEEGFQQQSQYQHWVLIWNGTLPSSNLKRIEIRLAITMNKPLNSHTDTIIHQL